MNQEVWMTVYANYYVVQEPTGKVRYQTVDQDDAVRHAQDLFRRERVMCDVLEIERGKSP